MPRTEEANLRIREERKKHILNVSVLVFARQGFAATKIADIAEAGEMSQGLIYRYFASKEEIFAALVERAMQSTISQAQEMLEQPVSPLGKFRWLLKGFLAGIQRHPEYALVMLDALTNQATPEDLRARALEQAEQFQSLLCQLIIQGQEAGEIISDDPMMLAEMVGACIQGLTIGRTYLPIKKELDPEIILRMIKA